MTQADPPTTVPNDDRAVSPVIGVILMVAITVILAATIGTFVLNMGQEAGDESPSVSISFEDADGADGTGSADDLFRLTASAVAPSEDLTDFEIRVINSSGDRAVFLGADMTTSVTLGGNDLTITQNGATPTSSSSLTVGDVFVISESGGDSTFTTSGEKYEIQVVWLGSEKPKIVAVSEVPLR